MARERIANAGAEWRAIAQGPNLLHHIRTPPPGEEMWSSEKFYESGRTDWEDFLHHWRHYHPDLGGACAEIGAGAGRMTAQLSGFFASVFSVDVSADMIQRARAVVGTNVEFAQVSSNVLPVDDGTKDAVFTVHVLQHLDSRAAVAEYLSEAHRVLRPGGSIMAHIMVTSEPIGRLQQAVFDARIYLSRRRLERGREHRAVTMVLPTAGEALGLMNKAGFSDLELRAFRVRSDDSLHTFFFGRRY